MVNGIKEILKMWAIPAVGAWFVFFPHAWHLQVPIVQLFEHNLHQSFGLGILAAWGVAWLLTRWK